MSLWLGPAAGHTTDLRACLFASISVDLAHGSAGTLVRRVGRETPVDAIIATHATRRKVQII